MNELQRKYKALRFRIKRDLFPDAQRFDVEGYHFHKCIFVHIPKCGGISIANALFGCLGAGHFTLSDYQEQFENYFAEYFKFTIVRNPMDRFLSAYNFLVAGGINELDQNFGKYLSSNFKDIDDFVEKGLEKAMNDQIHFKKQCYFLKDPSGNIPLNFIGRFEQIEKDFNYITQQLGIDAKLPLLNTNTNKKQLVLNEASILKIQELYKEDFITLSYDFNIA